MLDSNGKHGVKAVEAYRANVFLIDSEIQNQRMDGVLATGINNLIMWKVSSSFNRADGVDVRNVATNAIALVSTFSGNYDDGFDSKHGAKNTLLYLSELNDNQHNGLEVEASVNDYITVIATHFDNNGYGTTDNEKNERNGMYIEGSYKVDVVNSLAEYSKGDGYKMNNIQYLTVDNSKAAYNQADGFDLRHVNDARIYSVESYQNYLTGLRALGNGEIYIEQDSSFYENGLESQVDYRNRSGLYIQNMKTAYISETSAYDNQGDGFALLNVADVDIEYSKAERNGDDGFDIETSASVDIKYETIAADNADIGFQLKDIARLYVDDYIKAYDNGGRGFDIRDVDHVEIYKTESYKNGKDGFYTFEVQFFYVQESQAVQNGKDGFFVDNGQVHSEVIYDKVIACENHDDGMDFQEGFDDGSLWFTPEEDVFSCDNKQLDLQFDGEIDVSFGTADLVAPSDIQAT
ncbi:MAG: hypothetical protein SGILL_008558, partial [Bacillariaceae sp.]